jgi:integrase
MRIFKQTYRDRAGVQRESSKHYVEFRDQLDVVRRMALYTDEKSSDEAGRKIDRLVACKKANTEQPEITAWLTSIDNALREKLASIGLIDAQRLEAARPLSVHLEKWHEAMLAKGTTEQQADQATNRVRQVIDACKFWQYSDIDAEAVQNHLSERRDNRMVERDGERVEKAGIGAQTSNHILSACKSFCRWMVKKNFATHNPLNCLELMKEKAIKRDMRHPRRVEPYKTVAHLLTTTAQQPTRYGMTGSERALLYRLAVESGLRSSECRALTRLSFRLDAPTAHVAISDGSTKNGKDAEVPLLAGMVALLREHLEDMLPAARVFNMPGGEHISKMFYADLAAAGIEPCDAAGRFFDFHALRHCTATYLAEQGVHPNTVKDIMRHSDLRTTLRYFKATAMAKRAEGMAAMPDLAEVAAVSEATNDAPATTEHGPKNAQQDAQTGAAASAKSFRAQQISQTAEVFAKPLYAGSTPAGALHIARGDQSG